MHPDDRIAITDLINQHGHLVDASERFDELFTADVQYDVTDLGGGVITGATALWEAGLALGDNNPVAHHVTNVVLTEVGPDEVAAKSKGLGVMADGSCGSVTYEDTVVRTAEGWRISHRRVLARRRPLGR
ncbi:nuclear transport factor 2 family protein [Kribbella sp. NBC_00709]|uniref:nuclear transport factor 2 family protein n=1 Tax=Kribbella sp. NBC_00709 TaxID=2975972 RepID=UPI002E2DCEB7|nr:nuclear transport factor 2 family protein [Kribbella sp. NBC_00709]